MKRLVSLLFHRVVLVGLFLIIQIAILVVMLLNFNNLFLPFYGVCFALSLFAVFWITGRSGEPAYKIAWIVPILIVPIFGGLFYIMFGGNRLSSRTRRRMQGLERKMEEVLRPDFQADELLPIGEDAVHQARYLEHMAHCPVYGNTVTEYFSLGEFCFARMIEELKKAERYIFVEYFIVEEGEMWNAILDILKEKNVKAVFFVTGHYCKTNPELVQRMIDEGHIVGNHSMNHPNFTTITPEEMYEEVKELHDYVQENFDYTMFLFRYPEGVFSEQSLAVLQDAGYQTSFWSYAYNDWDQNNQPDPDTAYQKVTGALHPGAIYLLHAVSETNSEILGDFIDEARSQGYEVSVYNIPPVENPREGASASSQTESQTESQSESGTEAE